MKIEARYRVIGEIDWICDDCGEDKHCYDIKDILSNERMLLCEDCIKKRNLKKVKHSNELLCF